MKKVEIGGIYKHFKGFKVKVLWEGFSSETLEPLVIYMHLEDGVVWVRPKKMFLETVKVNGKKIERFKKIAHLPAVLPAPKLVQAGRILIKPRKR
ncbi:MAG: DUF1653 domain-containing protein [Candidatus Paceibacterota bacterium]